MNNGGLNQINIGNPLPDWKLESIFGDAVPDKQDFIGKPLLILLFSLGCPGCVGRAIPFANRTVYEHGEKVKVLGIHTNFEGVDFTTALFQKNKEELFIRFPFYKDFKYNTTFLEYGAGGTPHWILTDEEGIVVYSIFGSDPNNALLRLDYAIGELTEK
jgi:hypothetical protein